MTAHEYRLIEGKPIVIGPDGRYWAVRDFAEPDLRHLWYGIEVLKTGSGLELKRPVDGRLLRAAQYTVVQSDPASAVPPTLTYLDGLRAAEATCMAVRERALADRRQARADMNKQNEAYAMAASVTAAFCVARIQTLIGEAGG